MKIRDDSRLISLGGLSGVVGTLCYVLVINIPFSNPSLTFMMAMIWPILSIVFVYALFRFVDRTSPNHFNHLAFHFAALAFAMVALMLSVQLTVGAGISDGTGSEELLPTMRLVDLGIDLAWDMFIGTSLIFLSLALITNPHFGQWWGIPSLILGVGLVILNVLTFPHPPNTQGLLDIGPLVGLYIILLGARLFILGKRLSKVD